MTTPFCTVCSVVTRSNAELISGVVNGDHVAWGELVERYSQTVWMATAKYELDRATRLDVVQTVWLRLHDRVRLRGKQRDDRIGLRRATRLLLARCAFLAQPPEINRSQKANYANDRPRSGPQVHKTHYTTQTPPRN